jgi:hypothetical protein
LNRLGKVAAFAYFITLPLSALAQQPQTPAGQPSGEQDTINPDRPGIADGSTVVGPKRFQLELGVQHEYHSAAGSSEHLWFIPTLLRYGLDDHWEIRVETNGFVYDGLAQPGSATARTDGYAPISIGFKRHWQDSNGPGHPSLGAILRVFPPTGSGAFHSGHAQYDLRFAADWDFAPNWSLNPNLGFGTYEDGNGQVYTTGIFAMTLTRIVNSRIQVFADLGMLSPEQATEGRTSAIADGGITYLLDKNSQLDASGGTGIAGHSTPHPFWSVGYSRRF